MSHEQLGIVSAIQASRLRHPRFVAPHDRTASSPPVPQRPAEPVAAPPKPVRIPYTLRHNRARIRDERAPDKARDVIDVAASLFGVTVADIISHTRRSKPVAARQMAMGLAAHMLKFSGPTLARIFDRDKSTIVQALRRVAELRASDRGFECRYDYAGRKLRAMWAAP